MRHSRGMGCINPKKVEGFKKGGKVGSKRLKTIDKDTKQDKNATSIGRRKKGAENFGNLSKFYKGN